MTPTAAVTRVAAELPQQTARSFAVAFTPDESRVAHMRKITTAHLRLWQVPEPTAENVVIAVSELVTNSIQHGHGAVGLKATCSDGVLRVDVTDGNPSPAQLAAPGDDDVSGRGLFLVAVLAHTWGVSDDGHTTWCAFRLSSGRP